MTVASCKKLQNQYPFTAFTNETARISRNLFLVFRVSCRLFVYSRTDNKYERKQQFVLLQIETDKFDSLTRNTLSPQSRKLKRQ